MAEKSQSDALFRQSIDYVRSDDLLADSKNIIESARHFAYKAINVALIQRNWLLGKRIAEEHVDEDGHAEYGKQIILTLSERLTKEYGKGFDFSTLYKFLRFYRMFPILDSLSPKLS